MVRAALFHDTAARTYCVVAANILVDASTPNFVIQEYFTRDISLYETLLRDPTFPIPKDGFIELSTKPGLGIDINENELTRGYRGWVYGCGVGFEPVTRPLWNYYISYEVFIATLMIARGRVNRRWHDGAGHHRIWI